MRLSAEGLKFLQSQEGLRLHPYQDVAANWTIGYGHLMTDEETQKWPEGSEITEGEALLLLESDVTETEDAINRLVQTPLSQPQFDALVDFVFNIGIDAFQYSTLLDDLNDGNIAMAAAQFPQWDHAGGRVIGELFERRMAEQRMFLNGIGVQI
jgi:lysozyme